MNEDIKILEEKIIALDKHIKNYEKIDCKTAVYQQLVIEKQAIENLIEENKELNKEMTDFASEWLHKDIIREKIEEYKSLIKRVSEDEEHYGEISLYMHDIQILQELLGDDK
jgi:uncharacterized tellurite resistance protein B-like protein